MLRARRGTKQANLRAGFDGMHAFYMAHAHAVFIHPAKAVMPLVCGAAKITHTTHGHGHGHGHGNGHGHGHGQELFVTYSEARHYLQRPTLTFVCEVV
jgi:hypothetical protein